MKTLSVLSEDPTVKLGKGNPELGPFQRDQADIVCAIYQMSLNYFKYSPEASHLEKLGM